METWEKFRNCQIQDADGRHVENHCLAINRPHIVRLRRNLEFRGIIARIRRFGDENVKFWKSSYLHISAANRPNMTKIGMLTQILTQATETWEYFRNSQTEDGGRTPYWKSFFGYNSAPYCPIKTKFGMRKDNHTHTKVWWWKCQISKIQHGGPPPFWKSLYLHISTANRPNLTKFAATSRLLTRGLSFSTNSFKLHTKIRV